MFHVLIMNPKTDDVWEQDVLNEFEIESMQENGLMVQVLDDYS